MAEQEKMMEKLDELNKPLSLPERSVIGKTLVNNPDADVKSLLQRMRNTDMKCVKIKRAEHDKNVRVIQSDKEFNRIVNKTLNDWKARSKQR